jgi:tetratricopeptide (TPR) repeat protein
VESEFLRAIALNPGYAPALHWYALSLAAQGRKEESITEIKLAREIDPRSLIINANVGWCYYLAGDADRAIGEEKTTLLLDPSFGIAHGYLGQAYLEKKQFAEAISEFRTFVSLSPGDASRKAELANAYALAGKKAEADDIRREFESTHGQKYISAYDWAMLYAGFHDKQQTLSWLEKAFTERNGRMVNLAVHPRFAFLRREPAFQNLLSRMGITPPVRGAHAP